MYGIVTCIYTKLISNVFILFNCMYHGWDEKLVQKHLESLKEKGLVKSMDHGAFTRIIQHEKDIQVNRNM